MAHPSWIDCDMGSTHIGDIGYLVEVNNANNGRTTWSLRDRPAHTNESHKPRLSGWCGETDNRSVFARGVVQVTDINARQDRARIRLLNGDELLEFLAKDGYPDLAE